MPSNVDEHGIPLRGSALHIAYYVNCEPGALNVALLGEHSSASIEWRSPLATQHFAEYKDRDFLEAVDRGCLADALGDWWPDSGPRWDALGIVHETKAVVLVEAKANVPEIANGPACGSGASGSEQGLVNRRTIARALATTREHFGISADADSAWMDSHCYQYANRLAHLCFFERLDVPARLSHVYFTDDVTYLETGVMDFDKQRRADAEAMGLDAVNIESATGTYLPARADAYERLRRLVG